MKIVMKIKMFGSYSFRYKFVNENWINEIYKVRNILDRWSILQNPSEAML